MRITTRLLAGLLCLLAAACASHRVATRPTTPLVLLVSVDALRADIVGSGWMPTLDRLARGGVHARWMNSSYPTLTFPNHYTLVTGLRPDHHGIIHNTMRDPALGKFVSKQAASAGDGRWWDGAEPIWVTVQRSGGVATTLFWPGSEAAIHGVRPERWLRFDPDLAPDARVDRLVSWLSQSPARSPRFATLYFDQYDRAAHDHGPFSQQARSALQDIDAALARLLERLQAIGLGQQVDLIVVSDHGMARIDPGHTLFLDDLVPPSAIDVVTTGEVVGLSARQGGESRVASALLGRHPHFACWNKADMPARWHYGRNPRVPPIVCQADPGWELTTHALGRQRTRVGGEHGYPPESPDMRAVFIANGPDFVEGATLPAFDNVDVYPLLAHLLRVTPQANDGTLAPLLPALAGPSR